MRREKTELQREFRRGCLGHRALLLPPPGAVFCYLVYLRINARSVHARVSPSRLWSCCIFLEEPPSCLTCVIVALPTPPSPFSTFPPMAGRICPMSRPVSGRQHPGHSPGHHVGWLDLRYQYPPWAQFSHRSAPRLAIRDNRHGSARFGLEHAF